MELPIGTGKVFEWKERIIQTRPAGGAQDGASVGQRMKDGQQNTQQSRINQEAAPAHFMYSKAIATGL